MEPYGRNNSLSILVYTDLDGTLQDWSSYSYDSALTALSALRKNNIPLIICSSKTRAEIKEIRLGLKNSHPFISENGGGIFIPDTYFQHEVSCDKRDQDYCIIELGTAYAKIRAVLEEVRSSLGMNIRGFGDLSIAEVADLCGFSSGLALLAKQREYDEPFLLEDPVSAVAVEDIARRAGLKIERGGRFHHLTGTNDKGKAVSLLTGLYGQKSKSLKTIGLGDSPNDLSMLEAVDFPVLVQKPDGSYDPSVRLEDLIFAPGIGPAGWNAAVLKLLDDLL
jgi:mannosyl-3-phosphoglycerate phosphatase